MCDCMEEKRRWAAVKAACPEAKVAAALLLLTQHMKIALCWMPLFDHSVATMQIRDILTERPNHKL